MKDNTYTITGTIAEIGQTQAFGSKDFSKREFVLTVENGKFDYPVRLEFHKERTDMLDDWKAGDEVTVAFDVRGNRAKTGVVYNSLIAWRIKASGGEKAADGEYKHGSDRFSRPPERRQHSNAGRPYAENDGDDFNF